MIDVEPLLDGGGTEGGSPALDRVAAEIDRACRDTGFFLVRGHGVDPALLRALDAAARAFFALPPQQKEAVAMARGGRAWRGWFPEGGELTAGRPDHKEGYYFGRELGLDHPRVCAGTPLHGPNLFPVQPASLGPAVLAWMAAMTDLGHALARGLALGLGLDAGWFDRDVTADPTTLFRIFRYPPRPADEESWGVAEHTDYGLLTILAHDGPPGLQVRGAAGWIDVPAVPDTFVVNLGDMLDRMTGGRYRSTPHRVRHAPDAGSSAPSLPDRDRLSFPFFFDPGWDVEVGPVPLPDDAPADDASDRWDGTSVHTWSGTYGDYLTAKVAKVFPGLADDISG
ncbi:isopenicillin N synthase family oxygenase [soil metagenome]